MEQLPTLLTTEEVADYLMVSPVTVRRFVKRGDLATYQIGNEYRFQEADIVEFIQNRYVPARNQPSKMVDRIVNAQERFVGDKRLTHRAQLILAMAAQIAERHYQTYTLWGDVWQAILTENDSIAAAAIESLELEYEAAKEPDLDFAEQAGVLRELLTQAAQESFAEADEKQYLGTEHILLALSRLPMVDADPLTVKQTLVDLLGEASA